MKSSIPFILAAVMGLGAALGAEKIYMPYFEIINVHPDYQYSTARLFKGYVDDVGTYELVLPPKPASPVEQPPQDSVRRAARESGCAYFLLGDLNRIGETVILNVAMYSVEDGKRLWGDRLKASGPDDLDPIFQKLARVLRSKEKAADDGDIYSVTSFDSRPLRQIKVKNSFGISIGGVFFTPGLMYGKEWEEPFVGGVGAFWAYDSRTVLFELDAETYQLAENSALASLSISAFKPFNSKNITPFGGGGLGVSWAETEYQGEDSEGSGLSVHGGGGIIFNRTATVQLRLQARYVVGLFDMGAPRNEFPRMVLVRMELAFGR